jgi:uncharacterized DUF497 family protein
VTSEYRSGAVLLGTVRDHFDRRFAGCKYIVHTENAFMEDLESFILLGMSAKPRLLVVVYAYRDRQATIRIISARKAVPHEWALYNRKARP